MHLAPARGRKRNENPLATDSGAAQCRLRKPRLTWRFLLQSLIVSRMFISAGATSTAAPLPLIGLITGAAPRALLGAMPVSSSPGAAFCWPLVPADLSGFAPSCAFEPLDVSRET